MSSTLKATVLWKSVKKKLNTNSSTESEVVGVHDVLSDIMWAKYFLEEQGIETSRNVVFSDNRSALFLELNGRKSKGKIRMNMKNLFLIIKDNRTTVGPPLLISPTLSQCYSTI